MQILPGQVCLQTRFSSSRGQRARKQKTFRMREMFGGVRDEIESGQSRQAGARNRHSVRVRRLPQEVQDPRIPHQTQETKPPTTGIPSMRFVQKNA